LVERFCAFILKKMKVKMPEITEEQGEVIQYGLELIIGEFPKIILLFVLGFLLGIGWYVLFAFIAIAPYRGMSGGFHLHTHLGCILTTNIFYIGNVLISKYLFLDNIEKYILIALSYIFGILMISMYAPADTENVPIISKKERKRKKILSYIVLTILLSAATLIQDRILSNILIIGSIFQTMTITRIAYKITKNEYGHEIYEKENIELNR
jgi:accessory gene regulator B